MLLPRCACSSSRIAIENGSAVSSVATNTQASTTGDAIDAPDAVAQRVDGMHALPSALCPLLCHRQIKKAQVSS